MYSCTFGLFGLGWGYDLFRTLSLVEEVNDTIFAADPKRRPAERPAASHLPSWDVADVDPGWFESMAQLGFFVLVPAMVTFFALLFELEVFVVLLAVVCLVSASTRDIGRWLDDWEDLAAVPLVGEGMVQLQQLYAFYLEHPPRSFFFYLFYPITAPIAMIRSSEVRLEFSLFGRITGAIAVLLVIDSVLSWSAGDFAELGVTVLILNIGFTVLGLMFLVSMSITAMTTSMRMNLTGHRGWMRVYTLIGLATTVPIWMIWRQLDAAPVRAVLILDARYQHQANFLEDLQALSGAFLTTHVDGGCAPETLKQQQGHLPRYLSGVVSPAEAKVFRIGCETSGWTAIFNTNKDPEEALIRARDPSGALVVSPAEIPDDALSDLWANAKM